MTFGSLFAGVGGFDIGFERAGMECKWQVELDTYCRRVLEKHWPHVRRHADVRTFPPRSYEFSYSWRACPTGAFAPDVKRDTTADEWRVDVICGGFPCQDIAVGGTRRGLAGERSGLWFEYLRIVRLLRPSVVVIENSPGLLVRGLDVVLCGLAASGFDAEWQVVRASDFTLPHRRERLVVVAYSNGEHGEAWVGTEQNGTPEIFPDHLRQRDAVRIQAADSFAGTDDGIRGRPYRLRGHAVGNAVCPAVAEWIGRRIMEAA